VRPGSPVTPENVAMVESRDDTLVAQSESRR
jgi:hypothetical protein